MTIQKPRHPLALVSGTSHPELARAIAQHLSLSLTPFHITRFANGEIYAKPEVSIRGSDVFIVQTATHALNEDYMELFIMIDALKRSFAHSIHVVLPHYGYARQDRVATPREPISAKLVADLIATAGANHVITIQLHSDQIQGFFPFPVDNLSTNTIFARYFLEKKIKKCTVVSPDTGGVKAAKRFADLLHAPIAILHKNRPAKNRAEVMNIVGDVQGRRCIIYDDMIDTAGSLCAAADALRAAGADADMYAVATHALFSPPAPERLRSAGFREIVVSDSLPLAPEKRLPNVAILSVAPFLAKVIQNVYIGKPLTPLYNETLQ